MECAFVVLVMMLCSKSRLKMEVVPRFVGIYGEFISFPGAELKKAGRCGSWCDNDSVRSHRYKVQYLHLRSIHD